MTQSDFRDNNEDSQRSRLFRAALAPSALEITTEAVAVASAEDRQVYLELSLNGWRWSPVSRDGPYPLLRIAAAFLRRDYSTLAVSAQGVGDGFSVLAPEAAVHDPMWAIVNLDGKVSAPQARDVIVKALHAQIVARLLNASRRQGGDEGSTFGEMVIDDETSREEAEAYITAIETDDQTLLAGLSRLTMAEWESVSTMEQELSQAIDAANLPGDILDVLEGDWMTDFNEAYCEGWDQGMREAVVRTARAKVIVTPVDEAKAVSRESVSDSAHGAAQPDRIIPPSDLLRPETTQFQCPECGKGCALGIRAREGAVFVCHEHGSFYELDSRGRVSEGVRPSGRVEPRERRRLLDLASRVFLGDAFEGNFLIAQSCTLPCNYVSARALGGRIRVELCSREWGCPHCGDRPLGDEGRRQLAEMGFVMPGPRENPEKWFGPGTPSVLADLLDRCLVVGYGDPPDAELTAYLARAADVGSLVESLATPFRRT